MTLERILLLLHLWLRAKILDGDATFNRGGGVALAAGHAGEGAGHVFEGGFALLGGCLVGVEVGSIPGLTIWFRF
jgi:hypothetical protein